MTATHNSSRKKVEFVEATTQTVDYASTAPVDEYVAPAPDVHAAPASIAHLLADFLEPPVLVAQFVQVPRLLKAPKPSRVWELLPLAVDFAETVEVMQFAPPLPAESAPPACVTAHVVDVPTVVMEDAELTTVDDHSAPAHAESFSALALVVENLASTTAVTDAEQAPVVDFIAPASGRVLHSAGSCCRTHCPCACRYLVYACSNRRAVNRPSLESHPSIDILLQSSTRLCAGGTGFDTWWGRHCEVIRIGDHRYEG